MAFGPGSWREHAARQVDREQDREDPGDRNDDVDRDRARHLAASLLWFIPLLGQSWPRRAPLIGRTAMPATCARPAFAHLPRWQGGHERGPDGSGRLWSADARECNKTGSEWAKAYTVAAHICSRVVRDRRGWRIDAARIPARRRQCTAWSPRRAIGRTVPRAVPDLGPGRADGSRRFGIVGAPILELS